MRWMKDSWKGADAASWWSVCWSQKGRKSKKGEVGRREWFKNTPLEGSALALKVGENGYHGKQWTRKRVHCDHYSKLGHTKDKCWLLHEKPANERPRQSVGRGFQVAVDARTTFKRTESATTQISLSKEQMDLL